ncbi:protein-tyrosine-phosphatase [Bizionia sediminis]|uniref:Protein-tyrosine-phosphatase n=1 Tax=Bizionia sediminis TaxID=1737064 RepID=A0ABW5KU84_9FLAO
MTAKKTPLFPEIKAFIDALNPNTISNKRKTALQPLINFIQTKASENETIRLNFICTHNSRRSHLAQIWAQTIGTYFHIENLFCYSAGTETTALYPTVAKTLQNSGFLIHKISETENPIYSIKFGSNSHPIIGFSKALNSHFNPVSGFAAVVTCAQADAGCPFIAGAEKRIIITFEDPKIYDTTAQQEEKYHERSLQIATGMFYVFSQINL